MTEFELEVLRVLNGEDVPGMVSGAAMWTAARALKSAGYVQGLYEISAKGREFLQERAGL